MLHDISIGLHANQVSAFIGPSGCGKSTFLRTLNRMNDIIVGTRVDGEVLIDDKNIYAGGTDVVDLRRRVGHGVPEIESVPEVDFRERGLRHPHQRHGHATAPTWRSASRKASSMPRCGTK